MGVTEGDDGECLFLSMCFQDGIIQDTGALRNVQVLLE